MTKFTMKIARQAILLLCLSVLVIASWIAPLDKPAMEQVDAGLKKALVSFASARAVSGVISVLQGSEIQLAPAGIGATLTPGQVLAPINELVKHFSDLLLVASISFGVQKVLINISGYWAISLVLTIAVFVWVSFYLRNRQPPAFLTKFVVVLLMLRFAVPTAALGSDFLAKKFMTSDYEASQIEIDTAMGKALKITLDKPAAPVQPAAPAQPAAPVQPPALVEPAAPAPTPPPNEKAKPWWSPELPTIKMPELKLPSLPKLPDIPDFKGRIEEIKIATEQTVAHMVKIMVIFLLQTLVIPILLLWILYSVAKVVFQLPKRPLELGVENGKPSNIRRSDDGMGH